MNIDKGLNEIATQILHIKKKDIEERLKAYSIICSILYRLDSLIEENECVINNYKAYKKELLWSVEAICMLDDGNEHSEEEHIVSALSAINKLKSNRCIA